MRVLCIASDILGNRTFGAQLVGALGRVPDVELDVVRLGPEDMDRLAGRLLSRLAGPLRVRSVLLELLGDREPADFDALVLGFWEAAAALPEWSRRLPAALAMDLVPSLAMELSLARTDSAIRRTVKSTAWRVYDSRFRGAISNVDVLMPMCRWVADGAEGSYGTGALPSRITYVPLDLDVWTPAPRVRSGLPRLLFVGNEFRRKGGELLFEIFERHLTGLAELTIASNDPVLSTIAIPDGVKVLRGRSREALLEEYRGADLLILPTRWDILPNVIAEAMSTGLPVIASRVGGIPELVHPGISGELMAFDASADEWGARVRELIDDRELLEALGLGARSIAEELLGLPRFRQVVRDSVDDLRRVGASLPGRLQ